MNSCEHYQELISRLVDGEISQDEHEALMAHLNTCSRCNAMYAVFHDLSEILAEESEALPEGLHENIMAGVRRSEIIRKNRRLRKFGLRTALTAAACAVLVLFAAAGFGPGERAKGVSIRTEEEARQILPSPTPDAYRPAATAAPAPVEYAAPGQSAAPMPASTAAPVYPDAYPAAGSDAQYTAPQPTPYVYVQPVQNTAPAAYQTPEPVIYQTPAPAVYQTPEPVIYQTAAPADYQTPEPVIYQTEAPAAYQMPAPVVSQTTPEPVTYQAPASVQPEAAQTADSALFQAQSFDAAQNDVPLLMQRIAPTAESEGLPETEIAGIQSAASEALPETLETAEEAAAAIEDEGAIFSLFSSMRGIFDSAAPDAPAESKAADMAEAESFSTDGFMMMESTSFASAEAESVTEAAPYAVAEEVSENAAPAEQQTPVTVESVNIRGKESRARLLAMIGESESELPTEATLTRLIHVTLIPEDDYASQEKMDIHIYGDFVYCSLYRSDGSGTSYRADCSLRSLDEFLAACRAAEAAVTPAPTADPYAAAPQP